MKALVYKGEKTLDFEDFSDPIADDDEVIIEIESVGICGSDMHAFLGHDERRPAPLILGHEAAGTITSGKNIGQRVTINPLLVCGKCQACISGRTNICQQRQIISMPPREGAFAQKIAMPMRNLVKIPDHISFDKAALTEPVACGWHAVQLTRQGLCKPLSEAKIATIGGGAIGLGAALALKAAACQNITLIETNDQRRAFIIETTGLHALSPSELEQNTMFDAVIDGVGIPPTRQMASTRTSPGGIIVHIGLGAGNDGLDIRRMTLQEISFIGSYTYTYKDFYDTAQAIFNGMLGELDWTEKRTLSDGQSAFEDILAGKVSAPKVILKP